MDDRLRLVATARLAEVTQREVRAFFTIDFGRERSPKAVSVVVPEQQGEGLLQKLRDGLEPGLIAFLGNTRSRTAKEDPGTVELVVGPGTSQFDILRLAQTDALNYGMLTEDLITRLAEIDRRYGITINHAETDTILFELCSAPEDLEAFAQEIYEFCPDIVDQGVGTVAALAESIDMTWQIFLWWD